MLEVGPKILFCPVIERTSLSLIGFNVAINPQEYANKYVNIIQQISGLKAQKRVNKTIF